MKKIILILIVGVLLTGCVKKTAENKEQTGEGNKGMVEEFTGNLREAMAKNLPMKCEWQQNDDRGASYVKGKDVYVETETEGKMGYMIFKDDCSWIWGDEMEQGLKVCNDPEEDQETEVTDVETGEFKAEGVDWQMEYKCSPAVFGDDKFTPPSGVEFNDMQQMMQNLMNVNQGE